MSQTTSQSPRQQPKEPNRLHELLKKAGATLKNNWGTKILSLALAIGLWAGLITQDPTLTREKTFRDVAVTVSGEETLRRNGYIVVSDLEELLDGVTLVVDVPQRQYVNAQASNYNVRLDLSRIREEGELEVAVAATSSSTYGSVVRITPAKVRVKVEEYVTVGYIPVNAVVTGTAPEGYHLGSITCDPTWLTVSGPRSLVEQVERAEVTVDVSTLPAREGEVRMAESFRLLDSKGQEIAGDTLQVTSESVLRTNVNVSAMLHSKREIDVTAELLYYGRPAAGYEVTDVIVSPETLTIAGERSKIDSARLFNNRRAVAIAGAKDTVQGVIELGSVPDLAWVSAKQFEVTVVIRPIRETRSFSQSPIRVTGAAAGMTATPDVQTAQIRLTGPANWVRSLPEDAAALVCDVSGLGAGTHEVPLQVLIEGAQAADGTQEQDFIAEAEPMTVRVTIAEKE